MAPPVYWKGHLKLSLVTCQVEMTRATSDAEKLRFHTLNRATGNRVASRLVDAVTGKKLRDQDEARGYPQGEDAHVILDDEDLEAVALESTRTIDIEMFVPADSIGWIWLDQPHYLAPADKVGAEAFAVIRAAMAATKTVGIARLVLARRERAVMLSPEGGGPDGTGIVLWTLRFGDEVRPAEDYYKNMEDTAPDPKLMSLVRRLIAARRHDWDPALVEDPVQARLKDIIAAKKKGAKRRRRAAPKTAPADNVVNIMDALKRSISESGKGERKR